MTLNTVHRKRSVAIVCHEQNKDDFKSYEIHFLTQQHTVHMRHNVYCCVVKTQNVEHVQQLTRKNFKKNYGTRKMPFPSLTFLKQVLSKGAKRYLYLALSRTVNKQKAMQKESLFVDTTCGRTKTHCRWEGRKQLLCFRLRIEDTEQNLL